ncbi:MAG: hypothetical protein LBK83_16385 [Treponema sp.]|jgi:hypothetical protein|nr:hypothetical protein [Treponema sp.]
MGIEYFRGKALVRADKKSKEFKMAKRNLVPGALVIALVFAFVLGSCDIILNGKKDTFVAVTNITGVPTTAVAGTPLALTGTVIPSNATNKTIGWFLKFVDARDAFISGNSFLTVASAGTVTVRAEIVNGSTDSSPYTQDFTFTVVSDFVPVTGITGVPTLAIVNNPLTLSGTVEPSNATNKTIVWQNVSNGVLIAPSPGIYSVIATIENGASEWSIPTQYRETFDITAYDAGISSTNPFGDDIPYVWAMDNKGGTVYVTLTKNTWIAKAEGETYNSGNYTHITGTKAASWTVTGGSLTGNTGLALIMEDGTMRVANFSSTYSDMNGTFTKLDTSLTFTLPGGWAWITSEPYIGNYEKIVAGGGIFTSSFRKNDGVPWKEKVKGTYPTTGATNPVIGIITHAYVEGTTNNWVEVGKLTDQQWNSLSQDERYFIEKGTVTMIIYDDGRCEGMGFTFYKQLQ